MKTELTSFYLKLKALFQSARGKDLILYLLCVVAASFIWVFLTLNEDVQKDFDVPVMVTDLPENVTPLNAWPSDIAVSVSGKGMAFVKYLLWEKPKIELPFDDYVDDSGVFRVNRTKIETQLHDYFGLNITINSLRPDSIVIRTTNRPGKKVPVIINADVTANPLSIISGNVSASPDSVMLYSIGRIPEDVVSVSTVRFKETNLSDTLRVKGVKIQPIEGVTIVPATVNVMIPVEPLIAKKKVVNINALNVPSGVRIIPFPYSVEVSFLVPMSKYSMDYKFEATVDYNDVVLNSRSLDVTVTAESDNSYNISYSPERVDYVVEYTD